MTTTPQDAIASIISRDLGIYLDEANADVGTEQSTAAHIMRWLVAFVADPRLSISDECRQTLLRAIDANVVEA